jgi:type I site-specific restriction endonuclease
MTSPRLAQITAPPVGLFDLVFVDEGHHAAAATWKKLIGAFDTSKTKGVLLTGTPYRRDNKPTAHDGNEAVERPVVSRSRRRVLAC